MAGLGEKLAAREGKLQKRCSFANIASMYLMYVDESGDSGLQNSPTRYFVLSGLVVHELRWQQTLDQLVDFRKRMRATFGLLMREEIHAGQMLSRPGPLVRIQKNDRLAIIRHLLDELAEMTFLNVITVRIDKNGKEPGYDPFEKAWQALIQRFENTMSNSNFPQPRNPSERGLIVCDETDEASLRNVFRRLRVYNPVPHNRARFGAGYRQLPVQSLVEDPIMRRSHQSYFIQAVDAVAFSAYQLYAPSGYVRTKGAKNYYGRLAPIHCTVASPRNRYGIVEL